MNCVECEHYYIENVMQGKCHITGEIVHNGRDQCDKFCRRKVRIIPKLIFDIATLLLQNKEAVLLDDGSPSVRFTPTQSVYEIEIVLRTICNPTHQYNVVTN